MKRTGDPLKTVANNTAAADATRVNMNVPKAPMNERMSNIPMRFQEKQNEQIRMMQERGYAPMYKSDGQGGMMLDGYSPKGREFAKEVRAEKKEVQKKYDDYKKPGQVIRTVKKGSETVVLKSK
jgi:hypothetical protein